MNDVHRSGHARAACCSQGDHLDIIHFACRRGTGYRSIHRAPARRELNITASAPLTHTHENGIVHVMHAQQIHLPQRAQNSSTNFASMAMPASGDFGPAPLRPVRESDMRFSDKDHYRLSSRETCICSRWGPPNPGGTEKHRFFNGNNATCEAKVRALFLPWLLPARPSTVYARSWPWTSLVLPGQSHDHPREVRSHQPSPKQSPSSAFSPCCPRGKSAHKAGARRCPADLSGHTS